MANILESEWAGAWHACTTAFAMSFRTVGRTVTGVPGQLKVEQESSGRLEAEDGTGATRLVDRNGNDQRPMVCEALTGETADEELTNPAADRMRVRARPQNLLGSGASSTWAAANGPRLNSEALMAPALTNCLKVSLFIEIASMAPLWVVGWRERWAGTGALRCVRGEGGDGPTPPAAAKIGKRVEEVFWRNARTRMRSQPRVRSPNMTIARRSVQIL